MNWGQDPVYQFTLGDTFIMGCALDSEIKDKVFPKNLVDLSNYKYTPLHTLNLSDCGYIPLQKIFENLKKAKKEG